MIAVVATILLFLLPSLVWLAARAGVLSAHKAEARRRERSQGQAAVGGRWQR